MRRLDAWQTRSTVSRLEAAAIIVVAVLLVSACADTVPGADAPPRPDRLASSVAHQAIKDGTVDNTHTAHVGIVMKKGGGQGICSGTLIAPNLVLTARHCVSNLSGRGGIQCGQTEFTQDIPTTGLAVTTSTRIRRGAQFYRVAETYTPSGSGICGRDIALIRLQNGVPSNVATPVAPRLQGPAQSGESYLAIGYGIDGTQRGTSGTRRILKDRRVRCVGTSCRGYYVKSSEFVGNGGACRGDSGGSAIGPNGKILGVASRADRNCSYALYTGVYEWRQWIRKQTQDAVQKHGAQPPGWVNVGPDGDGDGFSDNYDNCPNVANKNQRDTDGDDNGDDCDEDIDGDQVPNNNDNCPAKANRNQNDSDRDGTGDTCDKDADGDGIENDFDNCPQVSNPEQVQTDADGTGDACDDSDGDFVVDANDNCPMTNNPEQRDVCNSGEFPDADGDGVTDADDTCPTVPNPEQTDSDGDGRGDVCDANTGTADADGDGVVDGKDNCPTTANPDQKNADYDDLGDACDPAPAKTDVDGDGVEDGLDNCPQTPNADQSDSNDDGVGDACKSNSDDPQGDGNNGQNEEILIVENNSSDQGCSTTGTRGPLGLAPLLVALLGAGLWRRRD